MCAKDTGIATGAKTHPRNEPCSKSGTQANSSEYGLFLVATAKPRRSIAW